MYLSFGALLFQKIKKNRFIMIMIVIAIIFVFINSLFSHFFVLEFLEVKDIDNFFSYTVLTLKFRHNTNSSSSSFNIHK